MPRPKTKAGLMDLSQENYNKLLLHINSLNDTIKTQTFPEEYLNRNIRDVLAHLHHWHLMMQSWYKVGMTGEKPEMPAKGYTWRTVADLNREIHKMYKNNSLEVVMNDLQTSFNQLQEIIASHTDKELFTKKKYHWTGSTSLASYLISATSSHYDWALKLIKKCLKPKK